MKPAAFDYQRAEALDDALATLASTGGDARIIAGGQSLMPMLNMRLARPAILIDIMRIPGLSDARFEADRIVIPAGLRQAALMNDKRLKSASPLLAKALPWVGHYQTRARGTLCGSIAHADPSAEIPLCLLALGGEVHLRTRRKARRVAAADFFTGMMSTARADDEMIEAISIPVMTAGTGHAFAEVGRRHGDFAIVACAAVADADKVRLAVGGVADTPIARDLPILSGGALEDALDTLAWSLDARADLHATAQYRRHLVRELGRRVVEEALACRS